MAEEQWRAFSSIEKRDIMTMHYANPDETTFTGAHFIFHFGAYGDTEVCVIQRPDHFDDALEIAAEWLKENEPGHFSEPDYESAARECGIDLAQYTGGMIDIFDRDEALAESIQQSAETDHTYTESGWLLSWEWTVDEYEGEPDFGDGPRFDRFDVPAAHATYWASWHQGQGSEGYSRLSRALKLMGNSFIPDRGFDGLSENGQAIYRQLALSDGR